MSRAGMDRSCRVCVSEEDEDRDPNCVGGDYVGQGVGDTQVVLSRETRGVDEGV